MIQFTDVQGNAMYIAKTWIEAIYAPQRNQYTSAVNAVVSCSGGSYGVKETVDQAVAKWNAA